MRDPREVVDIILEPDERTVLLAGLLSYRESSRPTQAMSVAMGFDGRDEFEGDRRRIADALKQSHGLSRLDWTRALLTLEVMFASDVMGAGYEWELVTGLSDSETLAVLRRLQFKLVGTIVRH